MTQQKTKGLTIVGKNHYTTGGIKHLLNNLFFQRNYTTHAHLNDIRDSNNKVQVIAVIDEYNINYSDIQWIERRLTRAGKANMLILCNEVLQKILSCVFKIDCLYVPHNAPLIDIKDAVTKLLLERDRPPHHYMNARLTHVESRILMMLTEGFSVKEISEIRRKNIKTISSLKTRLMRKLGMPNTMKALSLISIYMKSLTSGLNSPP